MTKNIDIPNGWEVKKLGEVVEKSFYGTSNPTKKNGKYPVLKMANLDNGKVVLSNIEFIDLTDEEFNKIKLIKDDILFNRTNSEELVGKIAIFDLDINCVAASYIVIFRINQNISLPLYLNFLLNTDIYKNNVKQFISKGVSQCNINQNTLQNHLNILLPPLAEQEKIAEILSLWDKAIEQTKELIAYKEKQKKGLMQNLLTGKKRLHGFTDKWKTYIVKELGLVITGKTPSTEKNEYYGDEFLFITPTDIHYKYTTKTERNLSKSGLNKSKLIPKNSVLITCIASIGKNTINKSDCAINQQINAIVPNNNFYYEYIYYYMTFNSPYLLKFAGKSATSIINKTTFEEIDVTIPPLDEQKAIADILCKADEEIELLNKQLDLYTEQKKGLMQNLLTGKVRVTV